MSYKLSALCVLAMLCSSVAKSAESHDQNIRNRHQSPPIQIPSPDDDQSLSPRDAEGTFASCEISAPCCICGAAGFFQWILNNNQ